MDQLIEALVIAAVKGVTAIAEAIAQSQALSEDQKQKHLADIRARLETAAGKVSLVKFKDV